MDEQRILGRIMRMKPVWLPRYSMLDHVDTFSLVDEKGSLKLDHTQVLSFSCIAQ